LKLYFRELPDPLMTFELYKQWTSAPVPGNIPATVQVLRELITKLPQTNAFVLEYLMTLLYKISQNQPVTKMPATNLAICWAPNILKSAYESPESALRDSGLINVVTQILIENQPAIFSNIKTISGSSNPSSLSGSATISSTSGTSSLGTSSSSPPAETFTTPLTVSSPTETEVQTEVQTVETKTENQTEVQTVQTETENQTEPETETKTTAITTNTDGNPTSTTPEPDNITST